MKPKELRAKIAKNEFDSPTSGYCSGHVQTNMLAIPKEYASSFEEFAKQNAKAIPVLEILKDTYYSKVLANGANLLNEIPSYNILEHGEVVKTVNSIEKYYSDDLVFFLIGCSFTFEASLVQNKINLRHIDEKLNVAMFNTNINLTPIDMFKGDMVVSMRPIKKRESC